MTLLSHRIQKNFNSAVGSYDQVANVQRSSSQSLAQALSEILQLPPTILDLGCGTGFMSESLKEIFPHSSYYLMDFAEHMVKVSREKLRNTGHEVIGVVGDIEYLPYKAIFNCMVSNFSFQWLEKPEDTLKKLWHYTDCLALAVPILGTFQEWKDFHLSLGYAPKTWPLLTKEEWMRICSCFQDGYIHHTRVYEIHQETSSAFDFMHYLKSLGAHTSFDGGSFSIPILRSLNKAFPIYKPQISYTVLEIIVVRKPYGS